MNSLMLHGVRRVDVGPLRKREGYIVREIIIETNTGRAMEITLFSDAEGNGPDDLKIRPLEKVGV